ncbi:hypothetical protein HLB42_17020 (plasmid) [Deinococcus sp. D7000]|nr:hypothetical protein HLB42_17020 [Deinococcus sp. D7000]
MTPTPDAPLTVIVNSGAQQQAVNLRRSVPSSSFTALVGVSQGDRVWITDLQTEAPDWMRNAHGELDTERGDDVRPWYDGYRAGLTFIRRNHLGWWWHCEDAPPEDARDVLGMPELSRLRTQPERYVIPPERGGLPRFLLLLTWLREDEMHFRVWQGEGTAPHLHELRVLL